MGLAAGIGPDDYVPTGGGIGPEDYVTAPHDASSGQEDVTSSTGGAIDDEGGAPKKTLGATLTAGGGGEDTDTQTETKRDPAEKVSFYYFALVLP